MQAGLDPFTFLIVSIAGWMNQRQQQVIEYLMEENRVLREQIGNRRMRFTDNQRCRLAVKAERLNRKVLAQVPPIVPQETLLAWHRKLIAMKYDGSKYRSPGRPPTAADISALVVRMAEENRGWGYRRIQGALSNLGHIVARTTIANILKRHGIEPIPGRNRKTTWKEFLARHWDQIVATDFFTMEVWTCSGLTRFIVLFFMDLSTRRVQIGGIASSANGLWMVQIAKFRRGLRGSRVFPHYRRQFATTCVASVLRGLLDAGTSRRSLVKSRSSAGFSSRKAYSRARLSPVERHA